MQFIINQQSINKENAYNLKYLHYLSCCELNKIKQRLLKRRRWIEEVTEKDSFYYKR